MIIKLGLVSSNSQVIIKSIDTVAKAVNSVTKPIASIKEENLSILFFEDPETLTESAIIIKDEEKFYPIIDITSIESNASEFENLSFDGYMNIYQKISTRWILSKNIGTVEAMYPTINYLKDMWISDRNSFFEELWFILKTNLAAQELTIIFNDLKEPTDAAKEKGEKPKLCHSKVFGEKIPQIFDGGELETTLMKNYEKEFQEVFNITEYNAETGNLVLCTNIEKSPILAMVKLQNFNQLQKSVVAGIFNGLQ